ncbi:hypothetical protein I6A84_12805 [Frankia sp. CNm7]|uniref:Uncharacterized protein n=1 Tax=Frankia nepalensis TaxID=1836974 RepID=A0A937RCS8_9ACTN|nr:hypothetical protein [Frankia nepalensis]MBL7501513.1 hypothetical protein [Frankia nepalensis]MBL7514227.1 hypothetical protein [Frankia nepalensis]MBL7518966.1 hypothetical protein [Frankia nepalensis]MBL7626524.1 hypothetical protein [Frankia nepalensis]
MTTFPGSPRTVRGGLVMLDPRGGQVQRVVVLRYTPDTLSRTLQAQAVTGDAGDRLDALRLRAAPIETIKLEAEIDATDQLELPDAHPGTVRLGITPELAALETAIYPRADDVAANLARAAEGALEIVSTEAPLTLFVWGENRIVPVRITDFAVTEEAFDPSLNPIRARVSLGLRVLGVHDLRLGHRGAGIFMAYHRSRERLAATVPGALTQLGVRRIP